MAAENRRQRVPLLDLGRLASARAATLDIDHHQRDLGHHRQADDLLLERVARTRGDGHRAFASVGRAQCECAGGDLVLGLVHQAADFFEHLAQIMRRRSGGRDRVHRADVHARGHHAQRDRGVAVDDDLCLAAALRRDAVLEIEMGFAPGGASIVKRDVARNDLVVLLAEDSGDLLPRQGGVQAVDIAQQSQHEHVLALARVADEFFAARFQRHLVELEAVAP